MEINFMRNSDNFNLDIKTFVRAMSFPFLYSNQFWVLFIFYVLVYISHQKKVYLTRI